MPNGRDAGIRIAFAPTRAVVIAFRLSSGDEAKTIPYKGTTCPLATKQAITCSVAGYAPNGFPHAAHKLLTNLHRLNAVSVLRNHLVFERKVRPARLLEAILVLQVVECLDDFSGPGRGQFIELLTEVGHLIGMVFR